MMMVVSCNLSHIRLGLPDLLGLLLSFPEQEVKTSASMVSRLALSCSSSLDSINAIVGVEGSRLMKECVRTAEEAVADKDMELLKPTLGLAADCLRADSALIEPLLPSLFASMSKIVSNATTYSQALGEALSAYQGVILYLPQPIVVNGLLNEASLSSAFASLCHVSPSVAIITVDILGLIARHLGKEGLDFLENLGAIGLLKHLLSDPKQDGVVTLSAVKAFEEIILSHTQAVWPKLKVDEALRERVHALAAKDVEYLFLAEVLKAAASGGGSDKKGKSVAAAAVDVKTFKIWEKDWVAYAGLQRSVMRSKWLDCLAFMVGVTNGE